LKREVCAALLLTVVITGTVVNAVFIRSLSDQIAACSETVRRYALSDEWESAASCAETALQIWKKHEKYLTVVLPKLTTDEAERVLFELYREVSTRKAPDVIWDAGRVQAVFSDIAALEELRIESIL